MQRLSVSLQGVLPVRAAVQHPDAFHRGSDADAQPEGEGGHPALHRGARPPDGPGRLCQLQRDAPRRLTHHHLDHRAQELRRPQGRRAGRCGASVWSHLYLLSFISFEFYCFFIFLFSRLDFFFFFPNTVCCPPHPQTLHNWAGEDFSGRPSTVASLPGEGNLEERCKQVESP